MIDRSDAYTLSIGLISVVILFVPIPFVTQVIGIPLLLYAAYRYWGMESDSE